MRLGQVMMVGRTTNFGSWFTMSTRQRWVKRLTSPLAGSNNPLSKCYCQISPPSEAFQPQTDRQTRPPERCERALERKRESQAGAENLAAVVSCCLTRWFVSLALQTNSAFVLEESLLRGSFLLFFLIYSLTLTRGVQN